MHSVLDPDVNYQNCMVAFINVLGWKEIVNKSIGDKELRKAMKINFQMFQERKYEFMGDYRISC